MVKLATRANLSGSFRPIADTISVSVCPWNEAVVRMVLANGHKARSIRTAGCLLASFGSSEAPLMFATIGAFKLGPPLQIAAGAAFVLVAVAAFAFTFSKFKD